MGKLKGKRILVAGSGRNVGAETARKLAAEGAVLFLGDINEEAVQSVAEEIGAKSSWFDLADLDSIEKLVSQAVDHLGGLDGVANVAADISPGLLNNDLDLLEMKTEIWERTLNANLIGYAHIIKNALPHILKEESGAIVNVSSGSYFMGEDTRPAYAASKAGVNTLTRHVASRWGKDNVRCNAVAPGMIVTETASDLVDDDYLKESLKGVPLTRLGQSSDIANGIAFLLSDEAEWITGQVININGGATYRD